ncbi:hypothetical protein jhhlp_004672 [Lomentospora prolificans]|uniref:Protein kinase domain-containing protein n=1 Tax=Lomentospora prolificans TaxID=41688 RepID=A0A2N3NCC0_9PEZI|nr:hypothetical protein jhhlp_004672 [Lomentospora prolificans]
MDENFPPNGPVATIYVYHRDHPLPANSSWYILTSDIRLEDPEVEGHQCHFWGIQYDQDQVPLYYVRNMSLHGTTYVLRKGKRINLPAYSPAACGWLLERETSVEFGKYSVKVEYRFWRPRTSDLDPIQEKEAQQFADDFEITRIILGAGGQGEVRLALNVKTQEQCVVKIINLVRIVASAGPNGHQWVARCRREAEVLSQLDHHNVVKLITHYRSPYTVYLFLELASGGDLTSYLERFVPREGDTQRILRQVVTGLKYIHDRGLIHRDVKPCNILLACIPRGTHRVCISDFGCAAIHASSRLMSGVGTRGYQAPEVHHSTIPQQPSADVWSLGLLVLEVYSREIKMPHGSHYAFRFPEEKMPTQEDVDLRIRTFFRKGEGQRVRLAKDFVSRCLRVHPEERMTAQQAADHPFLRSNDGVWSVVERIHEEGIPKVTPITTLGGELDDVAPKSRLGLKALPSSDSGSNVGRFGVPQGVAEDIAHGARSQSQLSSNQTVELQARVGRRVYPASHRDRANRFITMPFKFPSTADVDNFSGFFSRRDALLNPETKEEQASVTRAQRAHSIEATVAQPQEHMHGQDSEGSEEGSRGAPSKSSS